jgi:uncharacterized protein YndB with AHSA1/START domain
MNLVTAKLDILQTPHGKDPIEISAIFPAPPARVFKAWTDPKELKRWFGPKPESLISVDLDVKVGGKWCVVFDQSPEKTMQLEGEYLQVDANKTLIYTWCHATLFADGRHERTPYSQVKVKFSAVDSGTKIELRHESIESKDALLNVHAGWKACYTNLFDLFASE